MVDVTPLSEVLEKHIDRIGLCDMLNIIANICDEKANHIRHNWQDTVTASPWEKMGSRLQRIAADCDV